MGDVVCLDETWVNEGHLKADKTPKGTMNAPNGKGTRLISVHTGIVEGFICGAKMLLVLTKKVHGQRTLPHYRKYQVTKKYLEFVEE